MTTVAKNQSPSAARSTAAAATPAPLPDPVNAESGTPYWGTTKMRLIEGAMVMGYTSHEWATMKQWNRLKRSVAKGEHGVEIGFSEIVDCSDGSMQELPVKSFLYNRAQLKRAPAAK